MTFQRQERIDFVWIIEIIAGFRLLVLAKKDRKVFKLKQTNNC